MVIKGLAVLVRSEIDKSYVNRMVGRTDTIDTISLRDRIDRTGRNRMR